MTVKCFLIELEGSMRLSLRRYRTAIEKCKATGWDYHNAERPFMVVPLVVGRSSYGERYDYDHSAVQEPPHDDQRWPTHCTCGFEFGKDDPWQVFSKVLYVRKDTGLVATLEEMPVGAMVVAGWDYQRGYDGRSIHVKLPSGNYWCIDGRCSNCTRPDDKEHRCWIRHGEPPELTVDKNCEPGQTTCSAGAGSIDDNGRYHGFLRNGYLT